MNWQWQTIISATMNYVWTLSSEQDWIDYPLSKNWSRPSAITKGPTGSHSKVLLAEFAAWDTVSTKNQPFWIPKGFSGIRDRHYF